MAVAAAAVLAILVWKAPLLVTLAQRSNVETLLLAFILVYVAYIFITTMPATIGGLRLVALRLLGTDRAQRRLQKKVQRDKKTTSRSYMNVIVRGPRDAPVEVPIADRFGKMGSLRLELAQIAFVDVPEELTHSTAQLVVKTLGKVAKLEGTELQPKVVYWDGLEEEAAHIYASEVGAFDRLERALDQKPLWPVARVDKEGIEELEKVMRGATQSLRESLLLPDVEYQAEFRIPVIPEPLALMQLSRRSQHADAVASMGCVSLVTIATLGLLVLLVVAPPWVPGK
jgi:hypothetical protein